MVLKLAALRTYFKSLITNLIGYTVSTKIMLLIEASNSCIGP